METLISLKSIDLQSKLIDHFIKRIVTRRSEVPCYSATFGFTTTRPKNATVVSLVRTIFVMTSNFSLRAFDGGGAVKIFNFFDAAFLCKIQM